MARRQRQWAIRARLALVADLGGVCVDCGSTDSLQIDHIGPRTWSLRKYDPSGRVSRYRKEYALGLLTVRCLTCNTSRGKPVLSAEDPTPHPW